MENRFFLVAAAVCILTHITRLAYEILKHKNMVKANKMSFAIIFTNMMLLWVSWFALCSFDIYKILLPDIVRYAGLAISVIGLIAFLTGLFTIKSLESYEGDLMTKGIYSVIRHPMYLGFICWLIGFPLFNGGMFSMILAIPFIINVLFWRYLEEKELVLRFPGYFEYKKSTIF
jgi:protein-S-isoprenylcysteine O-methyltransferase Ste14